MDDKSGYNFVGVIPARYHSTRFPGKVLEPIDGLPMVVKVYNQVLKSRLKNIIVAVDNKLVEKKLNDLNIPNIMTSNKLNSGTERVAEVATKIDGEIFINIQGDEPFIDPSIINLLINLFNEVKSIKMGTIASTKLSKNELDDINIVKVLIDKDKKAIKFFRKKPEINYHEKVYKHLGIYGFTKEFLIKFSTMSPTIGEKKLKLEQLRALENNIPINIELTNLDSLGVNTPSDLLKLKENFKIE
tara:strand:+ start:9308 stop:10039 length:732 start_codon:yes stop_codon:yes gene_type:complete